MLKEGDEVVLVQWRQAWGLGVVERVTPTLAVVDGKRFKRDNGASHGRPSLFLNVAGRNRPITHVQPATPEWKESLERNVRAVEEQAKKQNMRWELRGMCEKVIDSARDGSLSDEQVAAAIKTLREALGDD